MGKRVPGEAVRCAGLGRRSCLEHACVTTQGDSGRSYLYLPHTLSRYLRLNLYRSVKGRGFGIQGILIKPHDFSRSLNHFFQNIAQEHPAGLYPKYLLGRQTYWTPVGSGEGDGVALLNEEGMVEVDKGSFSIMPFLVADGRLITWADATLDQGLTKQLSPHSLPRNGEPATCS